jgi:type IV secretory pathway TrbL component
MPLALCTAQQLNNRPLAEQPSSRKHRNIHFAARTKLAHHVQSIICVAFPLTVNIDGPARIGS